MTAGDGDVVDLDKAREDRLDRAIEELARQVRELAGQMGLAPADTPLTGI